MKNANRDVLGLSSYAPVALALLRIVTGLLFIEHGTVKLFGFPAGAAPGQVSNLASLLGIAAILEVAGGLAIVLGFFTRPVAFILSGQMAVAYFIAHAAKSIYPVLNGGEPAILFCFIFLYLAAAGGGAYSLDASRNGS